MEDFASQITSPAFLASALVGAAAFMTIISVFLPMLQGDKLEARLKNVTNRREQLRKQHRASLEGEQRKGIRRESRGFASDVVKKFDLQKLLEDENIETKMAQAGLRGPQPLAVFYFCRFALPFVGILAAAIWFFVRENDASMQIKYGSLVFGAAIGFYLPNLYVSQIAAKRQESIMKAFPDALDMLLICVESGMSVEMAFAKVGSEIGTASPELAEELQLTTAELSFLQERRHAYENLAKRTGHDGVKAVVMALIQGERYGTPLGDALRVMAKENRDMRMSEAEKKAAALPAKLTVPMILFFLPVLFLVVLGPAYIKYNEMSAANKAAVEADE
jgi:tight adherence protein C